MHKCRNVGCNESFKWRMQLCRHETKCTKRRAAKSEAVLQSADGYQCSKCGRTYKYKENVYRHFKICKQKLQANQQLRQDVFMCWKCHRPFISKELLDSHVSQCNLYIDTNNDTNMMLVIPIDEHLMQSGDPPVASAANHKVDSVDKPLSHIEKAKNLSPTLPKQKTDVVSAQSVPMYKHPQHAFAPMYYSAVDVTTSKLASVPKGYPSQASKPSSIVHNFPVDVKAVKRRICGNCQRQFVRYDHFQRHVKKCGKLKKLTMEEIQQSLTCSNCDRKYQRRDHYERHTKKCTNVKSRVSFSNAAVNNSSIKQRIQSIPAQEPNHFPFNMSTILPTVKLSVSSSMPQRSNPGSMVAAYPSQHPINSLPTSYLPLYSAKTTSMYHHSIKSNVFHEVYKPEQSNTQLSPQELPNSRLQAVTEQPKVEVIDIRAKVDEVVEPQCTNALSSKFVRYSTRRCWSRALSPNCVTVISKHDGTMKELPVKCKTECMEGNRKTTDKIYLTKRSRSCADIAERLIDIHKGELMSKVEHLTDTFTDKPTSMVNGDLKLENPFLIKDEFPSDISSRPSDSQVGGSAAIVMTAENNEDTETYNDDECPTICLVTPEEEENLTPEKEMEFTENISTALIAYLKKLYSSENSQNFHQMMNEIFHNKLTDQQFIYWLYKRFQS